MLPVSLTVVITEMKDSFPPVIARGAIFPL